MGNTNFSLWGMGNLKTNIPQYSPQWGILGINPNRKLEFIQFMRETRKNLKKKKKRKEKKRNFVRKRKKKHFVKKS